MTSEQTYSSYLNIDKLLSLQKPVSKGPKHDETLFIIIHQTYELWFKEILHELDRLFFLLRQNNAPASSHTLKRITSIFRVLNSQFEILETMTPMEFLSFRDVLGGASGFQSRQFRELEFALGFKDKSIVQSFPPGSRDRDILEKRFGAASLWEEFLAFLSREASRSSEKLSSNQNEENFLAPDEARKIIIKIYQTGSPLTHICEGLLDLDELLQKWRASHLMMVKRTLGSKMGTGGSSGAEYLASTLSRVAFPDLWDIRNELEYDNN